MLLAHFLEPESLCLPAVTADELEGADLESWKACQTKVEDLGFSAEEADKFLTKAFAWKKGYWGPDKKQPEVPSTEQVLLPGFTCCAVAMLLGKEQSLNLADQPGPQLQ